MELFVQKCIACNRTLPSISSEITSCKCGHVVKDALLKENTRKRKAPFRVDSISSEWIGMARLPKMYKKKATHEKRKSPLAQQQTDNNEVKEIAEEPSTEVHEGDLEKKERAREIMEIIEKSYKNSYFNRCKSYRKIRLVDIDFQFDFASFETPTSFYPGALEAINSKIARMDAFWSRGEMS